MNKTNSRMLKYCRDLRKNQTDVEKILWFHLRRKQILGLTFRRQSIIGGYIVDFVCVSRGLVIELDGGQHSTQTEYDNQRTKILNQLGYRVIRFWNNDVLQNLEGVLERLYIEIGT